MYHIHLSSSRDLFGLSHLNSSPPLYFRETLSMQRVNSMLVVDHNPCCIAKYEGDPYLQQKLYIDAFELFWETLTKIFPDVGPNFLVHKEETLQNIP